MEGAAGSLPPGATTFGTLRNTSLLLAQAQGIQNERLCLTTGGGVRGDVDTPVWIDTQRGYLTNQPIT